MVSLVMTRIYTRAEWSLLTPDERGPCEEWQGAYNQDGYGTVANPAKEGQYLAHRLAWVNIHGSIPDETPKVLHHCDNPICVRVSHLFVGTHKDNMEDMNDKGRGRKSTGDDHWTRTNPEKLATGSRNGMSTHPESIRRGEDKPNAVLISGEREAIRQKYGPPRKRGTNQFLINPNQVTLRELAEEYSVSVSTISRIVNGE